MLYQLPSGKTIELTIEQYLMMTDEDIEYLIAYGHGEEFNNPWRGSSLDNPKKESKDKEDPEELPDIPIDDRLSDPEFSTED